MKKKTAAKTRKTKAFRLELGWGGMFGLLVVCFCLFLWMFLLGMWAGQVIFPPTGEAGGAGKSRTTVGMSSANSAIDHVRRAGTHYCQSGLVPGREGPVS
ncbi:hypothetical protein [Desulfobulbus alkaliphilus]|uniref:hypothetical protein n=1 Tax=Desulfobulbus alkaliphilus TaxID=869814 RepID=UPI001963B93A|nr:hypothetical protein [Desulfobulbus alkaliphilus]MBM9535494.1 hypothetical protein [Desulfobulbus alkaliphilus]